MTNSNHKQPCQADGCTLEAVDMRHAAMNWLVSTNPSRKAEGVKSLNAAWLSGQLALDTAATLPEPAAIPGRPEQPLLVSPLEVGKRSMRTPEGRAALVHALAHIEFNAINLALDAIWRFAGMPVQYYADWLKVAAEEAYHFELLNGYLLNAGYRYGDFSAHNSLWEMAERTRDDVLARIALVPRTMEARGLDASPPLRNKFLQIGDADAAGILDIILRDEIGHVAIGNHWFNWLCSQRGLEPIAAYRALATQYRAPAMRKPLNMEARRKAGFTEEELALL
ncbi:ferritin-like domain-containing protein [Methylotenera sp. G11]|uniref:ferritin-like domain-containing protein n=1 Tax=Methylotenera sp. G11 TaxID=1506585 RepID=UPI00068EE6D5|nr:ferritin-like domain-containing protein [Methylotenera sp. G11]